MLKKVLLASVFLFAAGSAANAVTLFSDDFDSDTLSLNSSLLNWSVTNGTVDVIGSNPFSFYEFYPRNGNYLDMDGTSGQAGTIVTSQFFNLTSGHTYTISFDYGKNGGNAETLNFGIGSISSSLVLAIGNIPSLLSNSFTFTALSDEVGAQLYFSALGGDNQGPVLDNVKLTSVSAVPLPAAAPLLVVGLLGLGAMARRRKTKV
jgi:Protein of unknown function (DUF642)